MTSKTRADLALLTQGLVESRAKAQALIMAGKVHQETVPVLKAGQMVDASILLTVKTPAHDFVSRGGVKLSAALKSFEVSVEGLICLDIGASTGGFTDVLLRGGAEKVYAVDVGHGQLAWKLRQDSRVVVMEKTNARFLNAEQIPEPIDLLVCDASFISLKTILPASLTLAAPNATLIALIKPQFEVGKGQVGKNGVVRDEGLHREVCDDLKNWMNTQPGWSVSGVTESPLLGPKGNKEFLIAAKKN